MKILTARQMREVDRITIEKLGMPCLLLMENAGRNVFRLLEEKFPALDRERIAILCGKGNNGGDGFVVARQLIMRGHRPRVILLGSPGDLEGRRPEELRNAAASRLRANDRPDFQ